MKRYGLILLAVLAVGGVAVLFAARADKAPEATTSTAAPKFEIDDSAKKNPWTGLTPNWSSDQFQFAVVADRTGGHRRGVFSKAVQQINLMHPEFVMSVGDLIEGAGRPTTCGSSGTSSTGTPSSSRCRSSTAWATTTPRAR